MKIIINKNWYPVYPGCHRLFMHSFGKSYLWPVCCLVADNFKAACIMHVTKNRWQPQPGVYPFAPWKLFVCFFFRVYVEVKDQLLKHWTVFNQKHIIPKRLTSPYLFRTMLGCPSMESENSRVKTLSLKRLYLYFFDWKKSYMLLV